MKIDIYNTSEKYQIIYADPPWRYDNKGCSGACENHYITMKLEDINQLPIEAIADKDCILFLWVTFPMLQEGLDVIKAWGFRYRTLGFNWVKRNKKSDTWFWGMGNWTRSNPEICLIGIKGKPKRLQANIHSIIDTSVERHSKKPDVVRDKIISLCGDIKRIELFARQIVGGWDYWGNEV